MVNKLRWEVVIVLESERELMPFYWTSTELRRYCPRMCGTYLGEWAKMLCVVEDDSNRELLWGSRVREMRVRNPF